MTFFFKKNGEGVLIGVGALNGAYTVMLQCPNTKRHHLGNLH